MLSITKAFSAVSSEKWPFAGRSEPSARGFSTATFWARRSPLSGSIHSMRRIATCSGSGEPLVEDLEEDAAPAAAPAGLDGLLRKGAQSEKENLYLDYATS